MSGVGQRIRELRLGQDLSQEQIAEILGITRSAVSEIERETRRVSADEIVKLAKAFNVSSDYILGLAKKVEVHLENAKKEMHPVGPRISVPQKNVEKFREVLLYLLERVGAKPNIGETVIYKLLYFIDFDYYEKYEEQLIGATYQKNHYGPTPLEFGELVESMIDRGEIERHSRDYHGYWQKRYLPIREPDLSVLNGREIELINEVINRLSDMGATQISEHSHDDIPWLTTDDGDIIQYEAVFYRTPRYSVREYLDDEEVSKGQ